jgi:hypothetical protein
MEWWLKTTVRGTFGDASSSEVRKMDKYNQDHIEPIVRFLEECGVDQWPQYSLSSKYEEPQIVEPLEHVLSTLETLSLGFGEAPITPIEKIDGRLIIAGYEIQGYHVFALQKIDDRMLSFDSCGTLSMLSTYAMYHVMHLVSANTKEAYSGSRRYSKEKVELRLRGYVDNYLNQLQ